MAAPVRRAVVAPAISSGPVSSPASTQVGDLLIFYVWSQGTAIPTHTLQANFFQWLSHSHNDGSTDGRLSIAVRQAPQAGAQSYTPYSISGATANQTCIGMVVLEAGTWDPSLLTTPPILGSLTSTGTGAPNPPAVTGLTGDFLIQAIGAWHVTTAGGTVATTMANYVIQAQNSNASHVTHLAIADRTLTGLSGATEDPAAFTDNVTPNGTVAATIAIPGAPSEITGSGSMALAAMTAAGAGAVAIAGAGAPGLAAMTASGTGTVEEGGVTGSGSMALAPMTAAGAGAVAIGGQAAPGLAPMTVAAEGGVAIAGAGAPALAPMVAVGVGVAAIDGSGVAIGASMTVAGAGAVATAGAGEMGLAPMTVQGSGGEPNVPTSSGPPSWGRGAEKGVESIMVYDGPARSHVPRRRFR